MAHYHKLRRAGGKPKATLQITSRLGYARYAAADGRLDRDFSALDRKRLEMAVRSMLNKVA